MLLMEWLLVVPGASERGDFRMARKEIDSPRAPREIGGPGAAKAVVHYTDSLACALLYLVSRKEGVNYFRTNLYKYHIEELFRSWMDKLGL